MDNIKRNMRRLTGVQGYCCLLFLAASCDFDRHALKEDEFELADDFRLLVEEHNNSYYGSDLKKAEESTMKVIDFLENRAPMYSDSKSFSEEIRNENRKWFLLTHYLHIKRLAEFRGDLEMAETFMNKGIGLAYGSTDESGVSRSERAQALDDYYENAVTRIPQWEK